MRRSVGANAAAPACQGFLQQPLSGLQPGATAVLHCMTDNLCCCPAQLVVVAPAKTCCPLLSSWCMPYNHCVKLIVTDTFTASSERNDEHKQKARVLYRWQPGSLLVLPNEGGVLCCAVPCCSRLGCAVLWHAVQCCGTLWHAVLCCAVL